MFFKDKGNGAKKTGARAWKPHSRALRECLQKVQRGANTRTQKGPTDAQGSGSWPWIPGWAGCRGPAGTWSGLWMRKRVARGLASPYRRVCVSVCVWCVCTCVVRGCVYVCVTGGCALACDGHAGLGQEGRAGTREKLVCPVPADSSCRTGPRALLPDQGRPDRGRPERSRAGQEGSTAGLRPWALREGWGRPRRRGQWTGGRADGGRALGTPWGLDAEVTQEGREERPSSIRFLELFLE